MSATEEIHRLNTSLPEVTVIIPTLALREGRELLERAVESVLNQEAVKARPLVVVNGTRRDATVHRWLVSDPRITTITMAEPSLPGALLAGRSRVETQWFSALDHDDYLLPSALAVRLDALKAHPGIDIVVTNGYRRTDDIETLHLADTSAVQRDPLEALVQSNWLLPGSWLSRTEAVRPEIFADLPPYLEDTYLALHFALTGRLMFLARPTVVWSTDTPGSASKSEAYRMSQVEGLRTILRLPLPRRIRRGFQRKLAAECHSMSNHYLLAEAYRLAWEWHLRCLGQRGGLRYLPYSRHLLAAVFRRSTTRVLVLGAEAATFEYYFNCVM